jgi:hydroxymethylpyrimidine pyrophosphatase-like HAD family hydrolase
MRFLALATDYDNTIATDGRVADATWAAIDRLRESGRHAVLVTGRELADLLTVCPYVDRFSRVVAENGGVLYDPATRESRLLADPPPQSFVDALRARGLANFSVSQTLVATMKPNEIIALELIRDLALDLHVVFNGDAVMIVHPGVSKASGLLAALDELQLSPLNVVGVGDAENDHALISACGMAVAVDNALPALKQHADLVTSMPDGQGVSQLIDAMIADDLRSRSSALDKCRLSIGARRDVEDAEPVSIDAYGSVVLVIGGSGSGKSTASAMLIEKLEEAGHQLCIFDPEGDCSNDEYTTVVGSARSAPEEEEVLQLLHDARGQRAVAVNMMRVAPGERPQCCVQLLLRLQALRAKTGRPNWLVFDEAHHLFPAQWASADETMPDFESGLLITVNADQLALAALRQVNVVIATGDDALERLKSFATATGNEPPDAPTSAVSRGEALFWRPSDGAACVVTLEKGHRQQRRHRRKYAEGLLIPERSFYFRGPDDRLNLRAHNLVLFIELAEGVDRDTWLYHLRRGDYSRWFREVIDDDDLANEACEIERDDSLTPEESLERMRGAVFRRYTQPENPTLPKLEPQ